MALSDAQKASIRRYLGWPAKHFATDNRLEQAMRQLEATAADESLVTSLLTRLDTIQSEIETAVSKRSKAIAVDDIQLRIGYELAARRSVGRQLVGQLSSALGVQIRADAFGSGGYPGFSGPSGPEGGIYGSGGGGSPLPEG